MKCQLPTALIAALLIAAGPKDSKVPPSPAALDGYWAVVGGHILIERDNRYLKIAIQGSEIRWFKDDRCEGRWLLRFPAGGHARDIDIYDAENPATAPCRAIYALDGNRLKICLAASGEQEQAD